VRRRGFVWKITKEDYEALIVQPCYYCELPNDVEAGVGLDRRDNRGDYTVDNVVSCCIDCNYARGDRFTVEEMRKLGAAIREVKLARSTKRASHMRLNGRSRV
jgi:hypothetical protein